MTKKRKEMMLSLSNSTNAGKLLFDRRSSSMPRMAHEQAETLAQKKGASALERFLVKPDYAYPNTRMNRDELHEEMNKPSAFFHDLRLPSRKGEEIGLLKLEILQCFGLPQLDALGENDTFCMAVCGSYAFKTDIMPPVANPIWLSKMRRACIFPLFNAYARLYVGVFDDDGPGERDDFAGRIVLDIARMRPGSTYDVTLPLRQSAHVYMKRQRGAIRVRFHISWYSERAALLSYFPKQIPKIEPNESVTVNCCDQKSFQNAALAVHGTHPPGRFSMKMVKALIREINFTRIHILRYMRKRELRNLVGWKSPIMSGFLFVSWMHSVYRNTVRYVPGNLITFLLLYLWKNYANFAINDSLQRGFLPPTWEEMFLALLYGTEGRHYILPLEMTPNNPSGEMTPIQSIRNEGVCCTESNTLEAVAVAFMKGVKVSNHRYRFRTYMNTFVGIEGVDFLVNNGYAMSREEAVTLGCQLAEKMKLFEHVARKHEFKDAYLFYHFLIVDDEKYTFTTHEPQGKSLFRMLRFLDEDVNIAESQLEMPYSSGADHPRFTVKESLVIRSKESKSMIKELMAQEEEDDDDATELGMESPMELSASEARHKLDRLHSYLDLKHSPSAEVPEGSSSAMELLEKEEGLQEVETIIAVTQLKKPPIQDIDVKMVSDRPITDVLAEARHKVHGILLHCFNDRTYVIRGETLSRSTRTSKLSFREKIVKSLSRRNKSQESLDAIPEIQDGNGPASHCRSAKKSRSYNFDQTSDASLGSEQNGGRNKSQRKNSKSDMAAAKEENDKLLKIGIYSNANRWVAKVGVIVQPIVEIAYEWLYLFRALFNIFTWRDPILSFWVSIVGPIVVVILHLFPWRVVFAVAGVLLWGPQNWLFRVVAERRGIHPPDMDKIIRKRKKTGDDEPELKEEPLVCNDTDDNRPVDYAALDQSNVRHVAVPYSPFMYNHRFYDWPPEPEYARVTKEDPQSKARIDFVPSVLDDSESVYTLYTEGSRRSSKRNEQRSWLKELSPQRFKKKQM